MRLAILYSVLCFICAALVFITPSWAASYARTSPNLLSNPTVSSAQGWLLQQAAYQSNISHRSDSSGSIQLNQNAQVFGPAVAVQPGKIYTCGVYFRGDADPTTFMRMGINVSDARGQFRRNAKGSHWGYPKSKQWSEAAIVFEAQSGDGQIRMLITRPKESPNTGSPMWIDDVYCGEGISFDQPASSKTSFNGGLVKVDGTGQVSIKQNGAFKEEFLRCMYVDQKRADWSVYGANSFNCNMWVSSLRQLKKGVDAGLPFGFFELGPYVKGWAAGNLGALEKQIKEILASPYADHLVGYYFDNESHELFQLATQVLKRVDQLDRKNGQRQRPIYILQGNYGSHAPYIPYVDMVGSYVGGGNTGGAGGGHWALVVLEHLHGQTTPVSVAQVNQGIGNSMRKSLVSAIKQGTKAMGFWRNRPVESMPWWRDFPDIVREALQVLGMADTDATPVSQTGSIQVDIDPQGAVDAGAKWRLSSENTWRNSGVTLADLSLGTYTIIFQSIADWITPPDQQVTLSENDSDRSTRSDAYVRGGTENNNDSPWPSPNLLPNANVSSGQHWTLQNARYIGGISRQEDGSGAIQLEANSIAHAPTLQVEPGKTYTCGLYFMTNSSNKTLLRLGLNVSTAKGQFLYNSKAVKNWQADSQGQWRKATIVHQAKANEGRVRMLLSIPKASDQRAKIWVDDIYCGEGDLPNGANALANTQSAETVRGSLMAHRHGKPHRVSHDTRGFRFEGKLHRLIERDPYGVEWTRSQPLFIYEDHIADGWSIDTVSDLSIHETDTTVWQGDGALRVEYLMENAALRFASPGLFTDGYHALSFAIRDYFEDEHTLQLHVYTPDQSSPIGSVDLRDYIEGEGVADQWREVVIPLADLNAENVEVSDFVIESSKAGRFYFDAILLQ